MAIDVLEIGEGCRRARLDHSGNDETSFLNPLTEIARTGVCPAETLLASFNGVGREGRARIRGINLLVFFSC